MNRTHPAPGSGARVLVQAPGGIRLRAALSSVEIMVAVTAAHVWAGGELPALPWLLATAGLVYATGCALLRGRFALLPAAVGVGVAQFGLHHLLTAMSPDAAHAHGSMLGSMSGQMMLAHALGALATLVVWALRRRAFDALVLWVELLTSPLPTASRPVPTTGRRVPPIALRALRCLPRRGPPLSLLAA